MTHSGIQCMGTASTDPVTSVISWWNLSPCIISSIIIAGTSSTVKWLDTGAVSPGLVGHAPLEGLVVPQEGCGGDNGLPEGCPVISDH